MITAKEILGAWDAWGNAEAHFSDAAEKILGLPSCGWPYQDYSFDSYDDSFEFLECQNDFRVTKEQAKAFGAMGFKKFWLNHLDGSETRYYPVNGTWGFDRCLFNPQSISGWQALGAAEATPK